jgi:hypothetical protein
MKKLMCIFAVLISATAWAGPDIPWPSSSQHDQNGAFLGYFSDSYDSGHYYAIAIEKNDSGFYAQCPYIIIIQEIDAVTGEVLGEHETLQCNRSRYRLPNKMMELAKY